MNAGWLLGGVGALAALVLALTTALALALAGAPADGCPPVSGPVSALTADPGSLTAAFTPEQISNATAIRTTGVQLGVPLRGVVIAVATALQESGLRNLRHGDAAGPDSRGLFQQRAAWGPLTERTDPVAAARLFYTGGRGGQPGLLDIPDWGSMSLTDAAQAVQHSATPQAYADDEAAALALVAVSAPAPSTLLEGAEPPGLQTCRAGAGDGLPAGVDAQLPLGFTFAAATPASVRTALTWALAQRGTPYSYGGDCTAAHSGRPAHQCDCSSLVQMAYRAAGIDLPRTTGEQVHAGRAQEIGQIAAGDLVFIPGSDGTPSAPGHVGLYVGEGLVVHAPHTGAVVTLARLSTWEPIAAVRRVAPAHLSTT